MFYLVAYKDFLFIIRGLLILVVVVVLGVSVAQQQLNTLTQRQEYVQVFTVTSISRDRYSFYLLGTQYMIKSFYLIGEISTSEQKMIVTIPPYTMTIPMQIEFDCQEELALLELWIRTLVQKMDQIRYHVYSRYVR